MPIVSSTSQGGSGKVSNTAGVGTNGGDATTTSATFVDVGVGTSVSINAAAGDVLLAFVNGSWKMSNTSAMAAFRLITTTGSHNIGSVAYVSALAASQMPFNVMGLYTVVSGDISSGSVAIKLQYATDGTQTLTVINSGGNPPRLGVINLLH